MKEDKRKGNGGRRNGAGRPKKPVTKVFSKRLPVDLVNKLYEIPSKELEAMIASLVYY